MDGRRWLPSLPFVDPPPGEPEDAPARWRETINSLRGGGDRAGSSITYLALEPQNVARYCCYYGHGCTH